jgi:hypothetical protein
VLSKVARRLGGDTHALAADLTADDQVRSTSSSNRC